MMTKDEALERIVLMRKRWAMYARTREAYCATLSTFIEVFNPSVRPYDVFFSKLVCGASAEPLQEPLDKEFAEKACDLALEILKAEQ